MIWILIISLLSRIKDFKNLKTKSATATEQNYF